MTYDWQTTFNHAISSFGDTPGAQLEQTIRDTFLIHPQAVTNAITKIIDAHQAGRIRSPWGALKSEIEKQITREATVDGSSEARQKLQRAEQWIRNAGIMYDRWSEVEDELFGDRGILHEHRNTPSVTDRMHTHWDELRPLGITTEQAELERAQHWRENRPDPQRKPVLDENAVRLLARLKGQQRVGLEPLA